ncbi:hypothetical protein B0H16DRAFT_1743245 [Mycena metata]|uniref:Uncharacterized protein n=1 Tax=Mycena metata TaxID=1033252 RepID=A0AAD7MF32_9AGAR|nr:hypothetical protein B0H16DRAFT_1743238 [Mycena metata]KAJ7713540.1 hypothetical protein B0H16DRAFT_1743245 [Mycena metata]
MSAPKAKKLLTAPAKRAPRRKKNDGQEPKKRGNHGNFSGQRLQFLEESQADYMAASAKGRGHITPFIDKIMAAWWARFPWYEGLDAEGNPLPPGAIDFAKLLPLAPLTANDANGATAKGTAEAAVGEDAVMLPPDALDGGKGVGEDAIMSPPESGPSGASGEGSSTAVKAGDAEDEQKGWAATGGVNPALKGAIQTDVKEKIKHWFSYRKTVANHSAKNPYGGWLLGFQRRAKAPKKLPLYKFYMQQEGYAEAVEELFGERWPSAGLDKKHALTFRCKLAQELLEAEPQEVIDKLVAQQQEEYDEEVEAQNADNIGDPDEPTEEDRHQMHSGRTYVNGPGIGKKFDEWDIEGFKKLVLGHFMKYLLETAAHCTLGEDVLGAAGASGSASGSAPAPPGVGGDEEQDGGEETRAGEKDRGRRKKGKGKRRTSVSATPSPSVSCSSSRSRDSDHSPARSPSPVEPPTTPELRDNRVLPDEVQEYVNSQPTPKQRELMGKLSVANEYLYQREVNIVQNRSLMEALGVGGAGAVRWVGNGMGRMLGPMESSQGNSTLKPHNTTHTQQR